MINCKVVSRESSDHFEALKAVTLPTLSGKVQVLSGHPEYFSLLKKGDLILEREGAKEKLSIENGVCYFIKNEMTIII